MAHKLSLDFLVEPAPPPLVDIRSQLAQFSRLSLEDVVLAPPSVRQKLVDALSFLSTLPPSPSTPHPSDFNILISPTPPLRQTYNERVSRQTILSTLFHYPVNSIVEYPATSAQGSVGHLFEMDPENWMCPSLNITYSLGSPRGQTLAGSSVKCQLLVDSKGVAVPCIEKHSTCSGCKVCPNVDIEKLTTPHETATHQDVCDRLRVDREERVRYASPTRDIFTKTSAYLTAIRRIGCTRQEVEPTILGETEKMLQSQDDLHAHLCQRGHLRKEDICQGRLLYTQDANGKSYHYNKTANKNHLHDPTIDNGTYDLAYIEAVLCEDQEEVDRIEQAALDLGFGPLLGVCTTVSNASSQKAFCPFDHRGHDGKLLQPLMIRLQCESRFRIFEPLPEYRKSCPKVLLICEGAHTHPVPLPTKTPANIRARILSLLEETAEDLPDMTPRRFIRHPLVKSFLKKLLPSVSSPTLADWHISLANRSHLNAYIKLARETHWPFGTDWQGVAQLKEHQDHFLAPECHYIRRMVVLTPEARHEDEEEEDTSSKGEDDKLRIVVCMKKESSRRLKAMGQYLQTDIAFKRIMRYLEFELACKDRDANATVVFCRVYLNRQTAAAHRLVFQLIDSILKEDTGSGLQWRHLHAEDEDNFDGLVLSLMADQHRGQALGLGLYLQSVAAELPPKWDLYDTWRTIQELSAYEHLERCFRVCCLHIFRRIRNAAVPNPVRWLMRSLVCLEHPDWDATLQAICDQGGKVGTAWVNDKINSKFIFPAICQERSRIPQAIWRAAEENDNLVEQVHGDVNHEGTQRTLVGGVITGQAYDSMRMKSLEALETYGIRPTYASRHPSENAYANLRRRSEQTSLLLATVYSF
ncbi:hypothetical protein C8J57DRAFT_1094515 [Mycena rebaudengoi]|nr:hypothetical protein C8J57DRAFT_1094515 [Mycena rebaudengoi]